MIKEVIKMLEANPFRPFTIRTSGGDVYPVASRDHAHITPSGNQVVVMFEDDTVLVVAGLHITAVGTAPPIPEPVAGA